ncbi:MAG: gamma-glutamylcyclotransferase [Bacteroidales bacterium]|nr:gamma-glutamylcyclotransferase [Bacteroidales bacterium]
MINNQKSHIIKIFVFGTLLKGQRFDFYMGGSTYGGKYYTRGQLMMAENGSVYIDTKEHEAYTKGEMYLVDYSCLQRINHLESRSGEFPKGYDLRLIPTWSIEKNPDFNFNLDGADFCFYYRRRNDPVKIIGGDYSSFKDPVQEIGSFLEKEKTKILEPHDIIDFMKGQMRIDF